MSHELPLRGGTPRSRHIPLLFAFHALQAWAEGEGMRVDIFIYDGAHTIVELTLATRRRGQSMASVPRLAQYRLRSNRSEAEPESLGIPLELPQVRPARVGNSRTRVPGCGLAGCFQ